MRAALHHGDPVAAVGKLHKDTLASVRAISPAHASASAPTPHSSTAHPSGRAGLLALLCDVRLRATVAAALSGAMAAFGRVDVVANCSGYGIIGACEDQDECEVRDQFEVNFFGTLNILQLSLPYFRARPADNDGGGGGGGGRYLIFSSTSGALGVPGLGPYCATKYAVEGLVESMLYEVDCFNIRATLVEPGYVRRDEPQEAVRQLPIFGHFFIKTPSEAYAGATSPAGHAQRVLQWLGDRQPTSVVRSAELCWQLGHCAYPPLRLLLGSYAVECVRDRLRTIIEEIEDWKFLSFGEDGERDEGGMGVKQEEEEEEDDDDGDGGGDREGVGDGEGVREDEMEAEVEIAKEDKEEEQEEEEEGEE